MHFGFEFDQHNFNMIVCSDITYTVWNTGLVLEQPWILNIKMS